MYFSKTRCTICSIEFKAHGEIREDAEKICIKNYVEHINSQSHKEKEKYLDGLKEVTLSCKSTCNYCGKTFEESDTMLKRHVDDDFRKGLEREVVMQVAWHMSNDIVCQRIRNRDNKLDKILP